LRIHFCGGVASVFCRTKRPFPCGKAPPTGGHSASKIGRFQPTARESPFPSKPAPAPHPSPQRKQGKRRRRRQCRTLLPHPSFSCDSIYAIIGL
jgi:hypothetical protein